ARRLSRRSRVRRPGRALRAPRAARLPTSAAGCCALPGLALAILLVLVARPMAVWISTAFSSFTNRERLLLGWAGLRGAVPIVIATFVLTSSVRHSETIFNAVFFVVIVSTLIQGTTLEWLAQRL